MASVRLRKLRDEYRDKIQVIWKSYPLVINDVPGMKISPKSESARLRAAFEEEGFTFKPWESNETYPISSMPALRASKCARLQGESTFQRFHVALFKAFFEDSRNIANREVLLSLAENAGLDVDRFCIDFDSGSQRSEIMADYEEYQSSFHGWGVPLAIFGGRYPLGGAVPIEMYRRAVDLCLASQSG